MLARLATVFLLASAAFVSAAPVDSRSTVSWKRQDDALASMLGNLTSVTVSPLSLSLMHLGQQGRGAGTGVEEEGRRLISGLRLVWRPARLSDARR